MIRILYISYDGMTDALGRSQVIPYLEGLSGMGCRFHVISCEKQDNYRQQGQEVAEIFGRHNIGWTPLKFSSGKGGFSKVNDIWKLKKTAAELNRKNGFHLVHCRSYIAAFAGLALKRRFGIPFLFDMRGFWVDERVEGNIWKMSSPFFRWAYKYFKARERVFFQESDAIISLTQQGKKVIEALQGKPAYEKTAVIPCCVDTDHFSPAKGDDHLDELRNHLSIVKDDYVLCYLGSLGTWYMLEEMLHFFSRLQIKKPGALFLFITNEPSGLIIEKARHAGIDPSRIRVEKAPRHQVPQLLGLAQASIFFIKPVFSKKASSPTKQGEIMSMGLPFITNQGIGDTDQVAVQTGAGILVKDFSTASFDQAADRLLEMLPVNHEHIRKCAIEFFGLEEGVKKYHQVYNQIAGDVKKVSLSDNGQQRP